MQSGQDTDPLEGAGPVGKIFHLGGETFAHPALPGRLQGSLTLWIPQHWVLCPGQAALPVAWGQMPHSAGLSSSEGSSTSQLRACNYPTREITTCSIKGQVFCNRHRYCLPLKEALSVPWEAARPMDGDTTVPKASCTRRSQHLLLPEHPLPLESPGVSQPCKSESRTSLLLSDDSLGTDRAYGRSTAMDTRGEGKQNPGWKPPLARAWVAQLYLEEPEEIKDSPF